MCLGGLTKYGWGSVPVLAVHCHPPLLAARSPSMKLSIKYFSPSPTFHQIVRPRERERDWGLTPVEHKIFDEETSSYHPDSVLHPPFTDQLQAARERGRGVGTHPLHCTIAWRRPRSDIPSCRLSISASDPHSPPIEHRRTSRGTVDPSILGARSP